MPYDSLQEPTSRAPVWADPFEPRLFAGRIMHFRARPMRHQFRYRVAALWLDADAPEDAAANLRLLSVERFNLYAFHRRDHGPRDGGALRPFVERALERIGAPPPARIMLLSFPRVLGYVFNPLSVYYGYAADGTLQSLVYEVKNTVGGQHAYAARLDADTMEHRHGAEKRFYVSPFISMEKRYNFTVLPPSDRLALLIKLTDPNGLFLCASWNGAARPLTDAALARLAVTHPFHAQKVIAGIYYEAIRLRLKGARLIGRPKEIGRPREDAPSGS